MGLVVFHPGALERVDEAARHGEHRQAAGHDQGHRDRLAFHAGQVPPKLAIQVRDHHQCKLLTGTRCALVSILCTRPSEKRITRSAMPAMTALWVMITVRVPSS